ncbi:MAG TPA: phosphoribosylamine--glycine ligase, partial [Gemmatimonadales bacterium]|nr:phosphoribosylamine--glycine ligase [Gemmatimonadales bacterium]
MRILVVGGGGREHALVWALRKEDASADLYCAPGNPGTEDLATNLPIGATDIDRLADAADAQGIDLTIIGPEAPLAMGLADRLRAEGRAVFGPSRAAAEIEASKAFAKEVMARAGVPTAASRAFTDLAAALRYVDAHAEPLVVKASGLAAGKGAVVCETRAEARDTLRQMLGERRFGDAGSVVVIEEFMPGEELSVLAITNGREVELLPAAQDHKRLGEGDTGPNTGGMGAYSPVALGTPALLDRVRNEVLYPTLTEMERRGIRYNGVLYAGLMIGPDGVPRVVEFNCRL